MKQLYSHSDYQRDTQEIVKILKNRDVHLVSLYRGSLPLGVKLSNILKLPLSIIDFQSYDGNSNKPSLIKNAGIKQNQTIVILDDIYDTGETIDGVLHALNASAALFEEDCKFIPAVTFTQHKKKDMNLSGILFGSRIKQIDGKRPWLVFPWDKLEPK